MMAYFSKLLRFADSEAALRWASVFVLSVVFILAIPSFFVPIGLPPEGDAVDYRIPIMKWILRHGAYPNWPWSYVDDFPMLQELLMLPFYSVSPGLARVVSVSFHVLGALAAGGVLAEVATSIDSLKNKFRYSTWVLLGAAWVVGLRPFAIQTNLFMTDNSATAFALGSLWLLLAGRTKLAGASMGLAMASKYFIWPFVVQFLIANAWLNRRSGWLKSSIVFGLCALPFVLPLMIRNFIVNEGNPFFPLFESVFHPNRENVEPWLDAYGRGKGLLAFLLLPYDILVTNSFFKNLFDYTIGKLYYLQFFFLLVSLCMAGSLRARQALREFWRSERTKLVVLVAFIHLLLWFLSSQQMRFLSLSLALTNVFMLLLVSQLSASRWLLLVSLASCYSILSIDKDSIMIGLGKRPNQFQDDYLRAKSCFDRSPELYQTEVGYVGRDSTLGYFDFDFRFVGWHVYGIKSKQFAGGKPEYIFGTLETKEFPEYQPWPAENPCLLKLTKN